LKIFFFKKKMNAQMSKSKEQLITEIENLKKPYWPCSKTMSRSWRVWVECENIEERERVGFHETRGLGHTCALLRCNFVTEGTATLLSWEVFLMCTLSNVFFCSAFLSFRSPRSPHEWGWGWILSEIARSVAVNVKTLTVWRKERKAREDWRGS